MAFAPLTTGTMGYVPHRAGDISRGKRYRKNVAVLQANECPGESRVGIAVNAAGIRHREGQRCLVDCKNAVDRSDRIVAELERRIDQCGDDWISSHVAGHSGRTRVRCRDSVAILDSDDRAREDGVRIAVQTRGVCRSHRQRCLCDGKNPSVLVTV